MEKLERVTMSKNMYQAVMAMCVAGNCAAGAFALETLKPSVKMIDAPLKPLVMPDSDQSVLLGTSGHQAAKETELRYQPIEDGGFQIMNGKQSYNRSITIGRNNLATGDIPLFKMHTTTGSGVYPSAVDRCFPLFSQARKSG